MLLLWAAGAAAVLGLLAVGLLRARALSRGATPVTDPAWLQLADRVRRELSLHRVVQLRRVPRCVVPMTFGWRRPVVLLPADADHWSVSRRRHVLLHELAHVRRGDWLGQVAAQAACARWWWQPQAWIAARELRRQRELACDDQVLAFGSRASEYADHLLAIAASRGAGLATGVATLAMARRSQLEGRLLAVLEDGRRRRGPTPRRALCAAAGAAALVTALACVQPQAEAPVQTVTDESGQFSVGHGDETIAGTVVGPDGQPVPGATVLVLDPRRPRTEVSPAPHAPELSLRVAPRARRVELAPDPDVQMTAPSVVLHLTPPEPFAPTAPLAPITVRSRSWLEGLATDMTWVEGLEGPGYVSFDCNSGDSTSIWSWSDGDESWSVVVRGCVEPDETGLRPAWADEDSSFLIEHEKDGHTDRVEAVAAEDGDGLQWSGTSGGETLDADAARAAAESMLPTVMARTGLFASRRVAHLVETGGAPAALEAIRGMPTDGARFDLLRALLTEHELSSEDFAAALEVAAESGGSDAGLAEVLEWIGPDALGDPELVEPLFKAIEALESDAYLAEALGCLLGSDDADAPVMARGLQAAAKGIESDAYMAEVLGYVPATRLRDAAVREAWLSALASMDSDAYVAESITRMSDARAFKGETLAALLAASAQRIESDAYMADVLNGLPYRALSDGTARPALLAAVASIESDAYMAEVAESWLCSGDAPPDFAVALIAAAAEHVDSDAYLAEILTCSEDLRDDAAVRAAVEAALPRIESRAYSSEVREWLGEEE